MKFYDIDVLAKKYGGGNKYLVTSLIAESAYRLSEKRNSENNAERVNADRGNTGKGIIEKGNTEKEKYLSEILAQFEKGVDVEKLLQENAPDKDAANEGASSEEVLLLNE